MKQFFLITTFLCLGVTGFNTSAQTNSVKNNNRLSEWILMIDNPTVNYYEAIKVYDNYWKNREKPHELENETMNNSQQLKEYKREHKHDGENVVLSDKEKKELQEKEQIIYQIKRFENWRLTVKPFVQEDGRILSQTEIDAIWQKQQLEISQQQK